MAMFMAISFVAGDYGIQILCIDLNHYFANVESTSLVVILIIICRESCCLDHDY